MVDMQSALLNNWGDLKDPQYKARKNAKYNRTYNNNNIITFDTETTSIVINDKKYSFVYIAMLYVNGMVYYCRNLADFKKWLDKYDDPRAINVIYVHNLGFDFAFLQNVIPFENVFARNPHKPIYARYKNWEFRCSYFLSQMSLANVGKYYDLPHAKYINGLNYHKRRHTKTYLTDIEEDYCELDVRVLADYIEYELKRNGGKYRNIPYTQTGFVRRFILENSKTDKEYWKLRDIVQRTQPNIELFEVFERCYTGGYTHANYAAVICGLYTNVKSFDITSSYPGVMCRCLFPMGRFREIVCNFDYYLSKPNKYCCVGLFRLENVRAKTDLCYISQHKIVKYGGEDGRQHSTMKNGRVSNGRIFCADSLEIYLTNIDVDTVKMMYECDVIPLKMWACDAGRLPKTIVKSILELYANKTTLKGVEDKKPLYLSYKQMCNSVYGMCVFNPYCETIDYNGGEWDIVPATPEQLQKYYSNRKTILPYQWGVFVTAHARAALVKLASQIGNDVLYMDTDSIKYIGEHEQLFEEENKLIHEENERAADFYKLNFSLFAPVDIKGNAHELGLWDFEHVYKSFKVLGAKRYCYTLYGSSEIYPVVAGCPTDAMRTWLKLHDCNALLKPFKLNIILNENESGKNTISYHPNHDCDLNVIDYLGTENVEHIGYGVCIQPATFDMSLCTDYLKFLEGFAGGDKISMVRKGVLCE